MSATPTATHRALARLPEAPALVTSVLAGCALGGVSTLDGPVLAMIAATLLVHLGRARAIVLAPALALALAAGGALPLGATALMVALVAAGERWPRRAALAPAAARGAVHLCAGVAVSGQMALFPLAVTAAMVATYCTGLALLARRGHDAPDGDEVRALRQWPVLLVLAPLAWLAFGTMPGSWTWGLAAAFAFWVVLQLRRALVSGHLAPSLAGLAAALALLDAAVLARCGQTGWAIAAIAAFTLTRLAQRALAHRD